MARNWAITIGINGYNYLSRLNYAVKDADAVRQFFSEGLGFHQVYHFTDDSDPIEQPRGPALVSQPTTTTLRRFLRTRFEEPFLRDGDNLWFFFAGHGIRHENRDYLMPLDGDRGDLENSAIPLHYISERLRRSGADNIILLIDACRSDKEGRRDGFGFGTENQQGVITIFSCSPEEPAYEIEELQQGAFTHALLESLRLQGEGNCATVERLYQRLRYTVPQLTLQYKRVSQTPYGMIEPPSKNHLILLPRQATLTDVLALRYDALSAESRDPIMAKQLWIRVLMVSPGDPEAIIGIERLSRGTSAPLSVPPIPMSPPAPVATPSPSDTSGSRRVDAPVPQTPPSVQSTSRLERLDPPAEPPQTVVPVSSPSPTPQRPRPQPTQPARPVNAAAQSSPPVRPSSENTSPSQPFVSPSALKASSSGALIDRISRRRAIQILGFAGGGLGSILFGRAVFKSNDWKLPELRPATTNGTISTFNVATINVSAKTIDVERKQAEFRTESLGGDSTLDMMVIPGGSFQMGSPEGEGEGDEKPQHVVTISPFQMGQHQVTQAQWRAVAALTKVERDLEADPSHFKGDSLPVEQVSWDDTVEFCQRLSQYSKREYRLPSEAEWEYACRAGTTTPFYFGETITTDIANYRGTDWLYEGTTYSGNYGSGPKGEYFEKTTEVGSFPANAFGLYDMHGNVWEWCKDHWHDNYQGAPEDGSAWITGGDASLRLLRGGSWNFNPGFCRSAYRYWFARDDRYYYFGFRVVCVSS